MYFFMICCFKSQKEISSQFTALQKLERMIKQSEVVNKTKEQDFRLALESRDNAVSEAEVLMNRIRNLEKAHKKQVSGVLWDVRVGMWGVVCNVLIEYSFTRLPLDKRNQLKKNAHIKLQCRAYIYIQYIRLIRT